MNSKKFLVALAAMSIFNLSTADVNFDSNFNSVSKVYAATNEELAETYHSRGMSYYESGEYEKAVEYFTKAIELTPKDAKNYSARGFAYDKLGKYEEALADFQEAGRLFPNYRHIGKIISHIYFEMGRYEEALTEMSNDIERHKSLDRGHPDYPGYVQRAKIYKELKRYDEAIADCNQAIEFKNDYAEAYYERGIIYQEMGEDELAEADFAKARELGYKE